MGDNNSGYDWIIIFQHYIYNTNQKVIIYFKSECKQTIIYQFSIIIIVSYIQLKFQKCNKMIDICLNKVPLTQISRNMNISFVTIK